MQSSSRWRAAALLISGFWLLMRADASAQDPFSVPCSNGCPLGTSCQGSVCKPSNPIANDNQERQNACTSFDETHLDACVSGRQPVWAYDFSSQDTGGQVVQSGGFKTAQAAQADLDAAKKLCDVVDRYWDHTSCRTTYGEVYCAACGSDAARFASLPQEEKVLVEKAYLVFDQWTTQAAMAIKTFASENPTSTPFDATGKVLADYVTALRDATKDAIRLRDIMQNLNGATNSFSDALRPAIDSMTRDEQEVETASRPFQQLGYFAGSSLEYRTQNQSGTGVCMSVSGQMGCSPPIEKLTDTSENAQLTGNQIQVQRQVTETDQIGGEVSSGSRTSNTYSFSVSVVSPGDITHVDDGDYWSVAVNCIGNVDCISVQQTSSEIGDESVENQAYTNKSTSVDFKSQDDAVAFRKWLLSKRGSSKARPLPIGSVNPQHP